ncbi:MAG: DegT/DnrJ/EryC1/StrS family aminotransferase, partial [Solobacterium sp.]|nr:DegT/DnrJ/EryC1/StrS family aminotransferase [Solobacterium sp.]
MKIAANNLKRQYDLHADEYEAKALEVLRSGWYILGPEVKAFEQEFASYIGTKYCVGLANGLDALILAFRILNIGEGDEVIVCGNAYIACVMGVSINGALPVLVEPDEYANLDADRIEEKITEKTKAILAVHLYGQSCDMTKICAVAEKYDLKVVEDCAQSHMTTWDGRVCGTIGDISCFSFYPTKGLGAFGDAGALLTDNEEYAEAAKMLRNYQCFLQLPDLQRKRIRIRK